MKHEAKLAIVFIGILGASFATLLVKRLSHPGNKNVALNSQPVNAAADGGSSKLSAAVAPPTLVTPKTENSRPPELAADTAASAGDAGSSWSRSARAPSPDYSQTTTDYASSQRQPTLASDAAPATANRNAAQAADPFQASPTATAQPYQSSYANTSDPAQHSTTTPTPAQPYISQAPTAAARSTAADNQYGYAGSQHGTSTSASDWRADSTTQQSNVPAAGYGYSTPSTAGSTAAGQHSSVFPVASADATAAAQHYSTSSVTALGAGAVTQVSGIEKRGEEYSIQPNDSFWMICQKAYGNGAFFKALREYNRKRHPEADDLKVGETLAVPDEAVLRRAYPDLCPKPHRPTATVQQRLASASGRMRENSRVYTVVDGDTLFEIARRELGKPSRWGEVYELNRDVLGNDFDYLKPGLELILPDTRKQTENVTRQPADFYQR
jgi:LysM domain